MSDDAFEMQAGLVMTLDEVLAAYGPQPAVSPLTNVATITQSADGETVRLRGRATDVAVRHFRPAAERGAICRFTLVDDTGRVEVKIDPFRGGELSVLAMGTVNVVGRLRFPQLTEAETAQYGRGEPTVLLDFLSASGSFVASAAPAADD